MSLIINGSNTPTAGSAAIGNGTELAFTAAGTAGQVLTSNGASAPTWGSAGTVTSASVASANGFAGSVATATTTPAITSITFSNIPTTGTAYGLTLAFTADGTARAVTWPAAVKWSGGTAPTLTSTNAKVDIFVLTTWDGGTTWYAMTGGQNF